MGNLGSMPSTQNRSKQKTSLNTTVNQISKTEKRWFAVYTKYKCEKYVANLLEKKQIEVYVPLMSKTRRYERKIKHYEVPLINCYVFACITEDQYIQTLETEYVLKFLKHGKDLYAIPQAEIDILKRITGQITEVVSLSDVKFEVGEDVEVVSGSLAGLKGKIVKKAAKRSFVIELINIGFQFRIEIDHELLIPSNILKKVG
jgi:transcription antitermination factor NusG